MEAAAIGDKAVHEKTKSVGLAAGVVGVVVQEQHCGAGTMCHRLGRDGTFGMRCQRKRTHKDTLDHAGDLAQNTVAFAAGIRVGRKIHARAVKIRVGIQNFQKFLIGVVKRLVGGIIGRGSTADQTQKIGVVQLAVSRVRLQQAQKQAFGNRPQKSGSGPRRVRFPRRDSCTVRERASSAEGCCFYKGEARRRCSRRNGC